MVYNPVPKVFAFCLLSATAILGAELSVNSLTASPNSIVTVTVSGEIAGESTFGYTIQLEIVPRVGNTGSLQFTPALPVDITQLGDPWPGAGTFSPFDTDPGGSNSPTLNGVIDDSGAGSAPVTYSGLLAGFPVVASTDAGGIWDLVLSTSAGDSSWEGLVTTRIAGTVTVEPTPCSVDQDCDDLNPCTEDTCDAGSCMHVENNVSCNGDPSCKDCNENDKPDVCDIAGGTADDINLNGIPDTCETCVAPPGTGDSPSAGNLDLEDYAVFASCVDGPLGGIGAECEVMDLDGN